MKSLKRFIFLVVFVCIVVNTIGCKKRLPDDTPIISIILLGRHANSQELDVKLKTTIQQIYASFGNMGIIVVDGKPSVLKDDSSIGILGSYDAAYIEESKKEFVDNNIYWENHYLATQIRIMDEKLKECKADDPEVNTLEALCSAVDSMNTIENSMDTKVKKQIIVLDTGLCTSGSMNFLNSEYLELLSYKGKLWEDDTMNTKVAECINYLDSQEELPKLKGISVTWYGLGQVSEPQQNLSKLEVQNLQYIWGELLKKAGALPSDKENADERYGIFVSTSGHGTIESDQNVTPISWDTSIPGDDDNENDENNEAISGLELPEQKVIFINNTDKYFFSEEEKVIDYCISVLRSYPNQKVLLVGTTSSYDDGPLDSMDLSRRRAERVKKTMIQHGFSEDYISTIGISYNPSICQDDRPNGQFEESIAQENRAVLILSYDSLKAQEILSSNE